jgi:hypothetical protein
MNDHLMDATRYWVKSGIRIAKTRVAIEKRQGDSWQTGQYSGSGPQELGWMQ